MTDIDVSPAPLTTEGLNIPPINQAVFDLTFDLLTCPLEDTVRKTALSAQTQALTGKAFEEFLIYSYFVAISFGCRQKALDSLDRAFREVFECMQTKEDRSAEYAEEVIE